jgi:hypothetical protein
MKNHMETRGSDIAGMPEWRRRLSALQRWK